MRKLFFSAVCAAVCATLLTACGEGKHETALAKAQWSATIYSSQREGAKTETLGEFASFGECVEMARKHLKEKGYRDGAYSCGA